MELPVRGFLLILLLFLALAHSGLGQRQRRPYGRRNRACTASQFKCRNGECIDSSGHCNGVEDCHDRTDELNCPRCRPDEFECSSGSCVSASAVCDGRSDCPDRSDEYNCNVTTCSSDQFRCLDGTCISIDKRCNDYSDCDNGEDEIQCGCGVTEFRCTDGRCIGYELQCNGLEECSDGSDERNCETFPWKNVYNVDRYMKRSLKIKEPSDSTVDRENHRHLKSENLENKFSNDSSSKKEENLNRIHDIASKDTKRNPKNAVNKRNQDKRSKFIKLKESWPNNDSSLQEDLNSNVIPKITSNNDSESESKLSKILSETMLRKMNHEKNSFNKNRLKSVKNVNRSLKKAKNSTDINKNSQRRRRKKHRRNMKNNTSSDFVMQSSTEKILTSTKGLFLVDTSTTSTSMKEFENANFNGKKKDKGEKKFKKRTKKEKSVYKHGSLFNKYYDTYLKNLSTSPVVATSTASAMFSSSIGFDLKESKVFYKEDTENTTGTTEEIDKSNTEGEDVLKTFPKVEPEEEIRKLNLTGEDNVISSPKIKILEENTESKSNELMVTLKSEKFISEDEENRTLETKLVSAEDAKSKLEQNRITTDDFFNILKSKFVNEDATETWSNTVDSSEKNEKLHSEEEITTTLAKETITWTSKETNSKEDSSELSKNKWWAYEHSDKDFTTSVEAKTPKSNMTQEDYPDMLKRLREDSGNFGKITELNSSEEDTFTEENKETTLGEETTDSVVNSVSMETSTSDGGNHDYKSEDFDAFTKYFHSFKTEDDVFSFTTSSITSWEGRKDTDWAVKVENELFEANSKVNLDLLSKDRLSSVIPQNFSIDTDQSFKKNLNKCKSKCAEFWRKAYENERKEKLAGSVTKIPKNVVKIDSGLVSAEETTPFLFDGENCTDSILESSEVFDSFLNPTVNPFSRIPRPTLSDDFVEFLTESDQKGTKNDKEKPKTGKKRKNKKNKQTTGKPKGRKNRRKNKVNKPSTTAESTIIFDLTNWETSSLPHVDENVDQAAESNLFEATIGKDEVSTTQLVLSSSSERNFKEFLSKENVDHEWKRAEQKTTTPKINFTEISLDPTGTSTSPSTERWINRDKTIVGSDEEDRVGDTTTEDLTPTYSDVTEKTSSIDFGDIFTDVTVHLSVTTPETGTNRMPSTTLETSLPECQKNEFMCDDKVCIDEKKKCNGVVDCRDASDESGCDYYHNKSVEYEITKKTDVGRGNGLPVICPENEFACDGACITANYACDDFKDCEDGADEADCGDGKECSEGELPCENGVCINKNFFCDRNIDCHDGSDERNCPETGESEGLPPARCRHDEFTCRDGSCIPQSTVCDGRADCLHNDDEANCRQGCGKDQFQCANGHCIRADQKCNNVLDCEDGSDEPEQCDRVGSHPMPGRCPAGYIMCRSDKDCVPQSSICNGIPECRDRSDEENCDSARASHLDLKTYPSEQVIKESREVVFQCRDEGPLRAKVRWLRGNNLPLPPGSRDNDGRLEIPNIQMDHSGPYICEAVGYPPSTIGSQVTVYLTVEKFEQPPTNKPHVCQYDEATCSNGDCIPKSYVCNGRLDCTDGSDEMRCSPHGCEPNEYRCNNTQCVSKWWRCDGDKDCADGSDEDTCAPPRPGERCHVTEFPCATNGQCIPKSYHCDLEKDCIDGSDEIGCSPVYIVKPPTPMITLEIGETLVITCTAIGVPMPEINWRLNWGHIPAKCTMTSVNGTGILTCPDIQPEDQGAYSCEGLNSAGFVFAIPDAIVMVKQPGNICPKGTFNSEARSVGECISCFCFGVATECHSANLFTYQIPPPFDRHNIIAVQQLPELRIHGDISNQISEIQPLGRDGVKLSMPYSNELFEKNIPYFALPENYHGNQLKSYGGYLSYRIRYNDTGVPNTAPSVILSGNNYVLVHKGKQLMPNYETEESIRFFQGEWYKREGWNEVPASREDIMMTLANVDNILIKAKYDDSPQLDVRITNIVMDTADVRNTGLGSASYVEECQCPSGYTGLSCEQCAPGYLRRESGLWLGQCYRDERPCPPGYYGDPSRNIPCQVCPCPHTTPSNQFARTCHLGSDGQPTCDCPPGYIGRRCEQCDVGYQGNPLIPGDMCVPVRRCDPDGSINLIEDPLTGRCRCKQYATGLTCNQCKANTFNLASKNQFGCISCFCMGITNRCVSSNWYRNDIRVSFTNSIRDFTLIESRTPDSPPIVKGIRLDTVSREIIYDEFPNRGNNDVYYWQLPSIFLGDQITSYGGNLTYTVRYVPGPGGQSSRNNAADVELISANDINLLYFSRESPEPNTAQTFTVPLLEQYWQRNDGTQADREHILMALADIRAIRIKATYTTHTDEAALSLVSLDIAENYNTGRSRAVEVEECSCPAGYKGLSCEDCDVGYTRASEGLYLGICEPCSCNGHSNQCNPDTGICENCAHHTTGDFCEVCEPGYAGDATRGTAHDCVYRNPGREPCICNVAGSRSNICIGDRCECKRNVEGAQCDRCRPSTFGLSAANPDGCSQCYCSGVTDTCHESSLYVQQIPVWIYDSQHGFTLTDATRQEVINEGFELNFAMNEIGYRYPDSRGRRLFWSLPAVFTGNKVKSYGGNLTLTQHVTAYPGAQSTKDQDVILIGNGITLFWTNPVELQPDVSLTYTVPLRESEWRRLTTEGPRVASRIDMMTVLSNLEAILVRATHSNRMTVTYISDISLDTAVEHATGNRRADQVELCRCPTGYTGTSCESCAPGYYRDPSNRSVSYLGSCNLCPCNQNEESCEISRTGQVKCHCLPGYAGQYCQDTETSPTDSPPLPTISPPTIVVYIKGPEFQIVETGSTVRYHCSGTSLDNGSLHIKWEKEGGQLPHGRSIEDNHGLLIIRDVKVSDSGVYVCQISDGVHVAFKNVTLTVGGSNPVPPRVHITPSSLQVIEGQPADFHCEVSGNPLPQVEWMRVHGIMSPEANIYNGVLALPAVSKNDAAEYKCIARNNMGVDEGTAILYVTDDPHRPGSTGHPPIVTPSEWVGTVGEVIRVTCTPSQPVNVTWSRAGNLPWPHMASQRNGVLTIMNPTQYDSGIYVCTATSFIGTETSSTVNISVLPRRPTPSVKVKPERQTVPQGTIAEVRCLTSGEPGSQVRWTKHMEPMSSNAQQVGDTLRIVNVQISDRGVYVCRITGPSGTHESSAIIEVEPREAPLLELYPKDMQTVILGGSADVQCRAIAGTPMPELHWTRQDGRPFPPNVKQLPGGVLRLTNITTNDGGAYVCSAVNSVGSIMAVAYIEVQSVPVIMISPKSGILQVKPGDRVRLMCSASGNPQPNVSWRKPVDPAHYPVQDYSGTPLSAVYEIFSVSPNDEGSYTCQAINAAGIVEESVQIRIEDDNEVYPPCRGDVPCTDDKRPLYPDREDHGSPNQNAGVSIPEDYFKIPNGGKVEMRCQVHPSDGNRIYLDWKRSDHRPLPDGSTVHNGVLNIPAVDKTAAGEYVCLGMNQAGAVLFRAKSHLEVLSPPRIVLNPPRQTVGPGENPSIDCTATGDEPMTIEWAAIGRSLPYSVSRDRGILQFHGITYSDAGKYVCKATNDAGTAEAVAEVLVNEHSYEETGVQAAQKDVVTYIGQPVRLQCVGREHATIHWSREGQALPPSARINEDYLELPQAKPEDSGRYICQIQTAHGMSSDYINLNILPTVVPAVSVEVSQDPVNIGDTIDIRCACSNSHSPRYRWSRPNHPNLPPNAQEYGNVLRLSNVAVSDSGLYRCTADTPEGIFEQDFNLIVHGGHNDAPAIETKYAPYGSNLEMDCKPNLDPPFKFQWNKLGGLLPHNAQIFESKLKLTNVKSEDAGTYVCTVNNDHENIEIPTVLVVTGVVPYFSQAPESFIALPPLPDSYLKFNIEISFKPESYDGIILYNDQPSGGDGDFILLSLVRGYPEFSFDLGSGPAVIRADKPISLSEWHTIKLQRNRKEGTMLVDGEGPYRGVAAGRKQGLDLKELMFIGGVPSYNAINKHSQIHTGFVGCISRLIIGEKQIDLIGDQTDSVGITTCETCADNPCNNDGVCQEAATKNGYTCLCRAGYSGKHCDYVGQSCSPGACGEGKCVDKETGFECYCPHGKSGPRCENSIKVYEPGFHNDKAFIAHDTPKALRRERKSSSTTHNRLRSRYAQVRKPRSRPHHHNNPHHTKH